MIVAPFDGQEVTFHRRRPHIQSLTTVFSYPESWGPKVLKLKKPGDTDFQTIHFAPGFEFGLQEEHLFS
jgi:hypothetical protein